MNQKLWPRLKFLPQSHRQVKKLDAPEFHSGGIQIHHDNYNIYATENKKSLLKYPFRQSLPRSAMKKMNATRRDHLDQSRQYY